MSLLREFALDWGCRPHPSIWLPVTIVLAMALLPPITFSTVRFPVTAVESNLARLDSLMPTGTGPRTLTSDQWADYLIFRLYPKQRVFFDGRSDFFGPEVGGDYRTLLAAGPGWQELLDRYGFETALLPRDWPLRSLLEHQAGWRRIYSDDVAVLFERAPKEAL